jgi:hypothetical protein
VPPWGSTGQQATAARTDNRRNDVFEKPDAMLTGAGVFQDDIRKTTPITITNAHDMPCMIVANHRFNIGPAWRITEFSQFAAFSRCRSHEAFKSSRSFTYNTY